MLSEIETLFVQDRRVAHLATADANGQPHVVPICFVYSAGLFYSVIDEKPKRPGTLRRVRNIRDNPRVAVVIDHYDEDWTNLGWVLVSGLASILEGGAEHDAALAALRDKYPQYRKMALAGKPVIKVTPQGVSSWGRALQG